MHEIRQEVPPRAWMMRTLASKRLLKALWVVAKLDIADRIARGVNDSVALARDTSTHEPSLYRVLRALACVGVLTERAPRTFELTPLGETLRSDVPGSLRDMVIFQNHPLHDMIWTEFMHTVRTGEPAVQKATGMPIFEYFDKNPEFHESFNRAMTAVVQNDVAGIVRSFDFSGIDRLVDVGGGHGALMCAILQRHPQMRGAVYDLPQVINGTRGNLKEHGIEGRCEALAGNFFESVPAGDAIIMSHIVHDWSDDKCATILGNCRKALPAGGRLLICEAVVPPGDEFSPAKLLDLEMMAVAGGRERSREEFEVLLASAGFSLHAIVPTQMPICVIEGRVKNASGRGGHPHAPQVTEM